MHALQPMQIDLSKSTMPSLRRYIARVGQACVHGASSHWLQRVTWNARRTVGNVPTSTAFTYVRLTPSGTRFSDLQAVLHAWQPMQRVWSRTFAQRTRCESSAVGPATAMASEPSTMALTAAASRWSPVAQTLCSRRDLLYVARAL